MSPTVFRKRGYRFFFFSREESRIHVHVVSAGGEAKFWLEPVVQRAVSHRYDSRELNGIEALIQEHYDEIVRAWREHFSG